MNDTIFAYAATITPDDEPIEFNKWITVGYLIGRGSDMIDYYLIKYPQYYNVSSINKHYNILDTMLRRVIFRG